MNCQSKKNEDIQGIYYMINKSGFVEFTITNDSIFNRKLFPNFSHKRNKKTSRSIEKHVGLDDRVLLLSKSKKSDNQYTPIMTLARVNDKKHIKYVFNSIDTTANLETIIKLNKNDKRTLLGFNLYSKEQIQSFQRMKPIESMSLNEFKHYLKVLFGKMKLSVPEFSKSSLNGVYGMSSSFHFQMLTQTFLETGFNPVQNSKTTDVLFKKYFGNPEIKELMENLKKVK